MHVHNSLRLCYTSQVEVCSMRETGPGLFGRSSQFIEVSACRADTYKELLDKAAQVCNLHTETNEKELMLFKPGSGCIIPNASLTIRDEQREWTLGNYLAIVKKKPSQVKLGVGYGTPVGASFHHQKVCTELTSPTK